jgi:hypothetical protein
LSLPSSRYNKKLYEIYIFYWKGVLQKTKMRHFKRFLRRFTPNNGKSPKGTVAYGIYHWSLFTKIGGN